MYHCNPPSPCRVGAPTVVSVPESMAGSPNLLTRGTLFILVTDTYDNDKIRFVAVGGTLDNSPPREFLRDSGPSLP